MNARIVLITTLVLTAALFGIFLVLPTPPGAVGTYAYTPYSASFTMLDTGAAIGAAVLMLMAITRFKPVLKPAYTWVAIGALLYALFTLVNPINGYFGLWGNVAMNIAAYFSYLFAAPLYFVGVRHFYRALNLNSLLNPIVFMTIYLLVFAVTIAVPHSPDAWAINPEVNSDMIFYPMQLVTVLPLVCFSAAAVRLFGIFRNIGSEYKTAVGFLLFSLSCHATGAAAIVILEHIGYSQITFLSVIMLAAALVGDIALLMSGFYFNYVGTEWAKYGSWWRNLFSVQRPEKTAVTSIDIINYISGLCSNPSLIENYLEKVREVAPREDDSIEAVTEKQKTLSSIYLSIENTLVNSDNLLTFSQSQLREAIIERYGSSLRSSDTFWRLI